MQSTIALWRWYESDMEVEIIWCEFRQSQQFDQINSRQKEKY